MDIEMEKIFKAAQECTGERSPDMWEARGERHLAGACACWERLKHMRTHGHLIGFKPANADQPGA